MLLLNLNERGNNCKTAIDGPTPRNQSSIPTIKSVLCPINACHNRDFEGYSLRLAFCSDLFVQ